MLHVVNGDATLALLKQSSVKGKFLVWRDMLMEGPVSSAKAAPAERGTAKAASAKGRSPKAVSKSAAARGGGLDWQARAAFLRDRFGIPSRKYLSGVKAFASAYDKAAKGKDEVVFWFEEDFFCQIHLVYILAHLPEPLKRKGRASIICPEKPLGVRLPAAFPKLLAGRLPVTAALTSLAAKVWKAYSLSSSKGWADFLKWARTGKGFEAWPMLKTGLRSHLGRLPSADGHLNAVDTALLHALSIGPLPFAQFARKAWSEPIVKPLGLGDLQVARYALDLAQGPDPLIALDGADAALEKDKPEGFADWKLQLTAEGRSRLADAIDGNKAATPGKPAGKKTAAA
jgi:hypothetical protein